MKIIGTAVMWRWIVVGVITIGFVSYAYTIINPVHEAKASLPVYGPGNNPEAHRIPDFSFINQNGEQITEQSFGNKIYVADFIFTSCQGICPRMTENLARVYREYEGSPHVAFISHTVKPEEDSVSVLAEYATLYDARAPQWSFVTGKKEELYRLAREGYMVDAGENSSEADDFVHTELFTLIDADRRIRGYYDGTDTAEVEKLVNDISVLLGEL